MDTASLRDFAKILSSEDEDFYAKVVEDAADSIDGNWLNFGLAFELQLLRRILTAENKHTSQIASIGEAAEVLGERL